jgi:glycosyltransferase involved in cell wall biosynthesis
MSISMINYTLSYIVTTRNKLPYLRECIQSLLANVLPDEEIIVVDGASTDGSGEYLRGLFTAGKIHQFLSEPDLCQAHATNKGMLMARGELIKIITDDDAYYFPGIRICKDFLLTHPDVDLLCGNIASICLDNLFPNLEKGFERDFLDWIQNKKKSFWFTDMALFIRRSQLPIIGLWHTGVICIDTEMSVRLTALRQTNLAWYTGVIAIGISNPHSNAVRIIREKRLGSVSRIAADHRRIDRFYSQSQTIQSVIYSDIRFFLSRVYNKCVRLIQHKESDVHSSSIADAIKYCNEWFEKYNSSHKGEMIFEQKIGCDRLLDFDKARG